MNDHYVTAYQRKEPDTGQAVYRKTRWFTVLTYRRACGAANKGYRRAAVLVRVGAASRKPLKQV